jgi:protein-disulfide isomerase
MKKTLLVAVLVFVCSLAMLQPGYADVEWTLKKQITVDSALLDIALSLDGQWLFALVSGEVLIYSTADSKIINRIPVDPSFDKLSFSPVDNTLLVASSSGKAVKLIQLEKVYKFSLAGLPFKGPENAPVTITVFSDYQ